MEAVVDDDDVIDVDGVVAGIEDEETDDHVLVQPRVHTKRAPLATDLVVCQGQGTLARSSHKVCGQTVLGDLDLAEAAHPRIDADILEKEGSSVADQLGEVVVVAHGDANVTRKDARTQRGGFPGEVHNLQEHILQDQEPYDASRGRHFVAIAVAVADRYGVGLGVGGAGLGEGHGGGRQIGGKRVGHLAFEHLVVHGVVVAGVIVRVKTELGCDVGHDAVQTGDGLA